MIQIHSISFRIIQKFRMFYVSLNARQRNTEFLESSTFLQPVSSCELLLKNVEKMVEKS